SQCERNYAQQTSPGVIKGRGSTSYRFDNDVRGGSSGSALMVGGETVGVVTHCADSCTGQQGNIGTRVDRAEFVAAREAMSACEIPDGEIVFETSPFFVLGLDVSPPDNNGDGDGFTAFGRVWDSGTRVTVVAPVEASSGWCFDEWRLDGAFAGGDTTLAFTVAQGSHSLVAVYAQGNCFCSADFNQDGAVDTRDVIAFLNAWNGGDSSSDMDGNGVIDTRDVISFLNLWNAGC
ncbi:MAG TPA: GC-type dockerin domain-anchored protein, partial [Planctomycetota bacterium]|nr:GC-type dockerin domain-anchored protein [Planctomycetota bacterium]